MHTFEDMFNSLFRTTVGFDRLAGCNRNMKGFPPYDIIRIDDSSYEIHMALAGYDVADVSVTFDDANNSLTIKAGGNKSTPPTPLLTDDSSDRPSTIPMQIGVDKPPQYLHKGIAKREFSVSMLLDEHIHIDKARLANGMLIVKLYRKLPERNKSVISIPIET